MAADTVVVDIELKGFGKAQKGLDELTKKQIEQKDAIKLTTQQIKFYEKTLSELETAKVKNGKLTEEESKKQSEYQQKLQSSNVTLATQKDELAKVNTQRRTAVKDVDTYNTALKAEKGSNEQLKAQLKLLTAEYNGLSKEQRENTEEGKLKGKQLKALTEKLKENEKAVGDNRRNVGNYSESIKDALGNLTIMGTNLGSLRASFNETKAATVEAVESLIVTESVQRAQTAATNSQTAAQKALNVATLAGQVALNVFKLALLATGIGAFAVVLGSVVAYFKSTEEGALRLKVIMAALGSVTDNITTVMASFGKTVVDSFTKIKELKIEDVFSAIGETIQNQVINRINALGLAGKALSKIFSGDAVEGFKDLGEAYLQGITGVEDSIGKIGEVGNAVVEVFEDGKEAVTGFTKEVISDAEAFANIQRDENKLLFRKRELMIENVRLEGDLAELRVEAADKTNLSQAEIVEKLEEARDLQEVRLNNLVEIAQKEFDIQKRRSDLAVDSFEDAELLAAKELALETAKANVFTQNLRFRKQIGAEQEKLATETLAAELKIIQAEGGKRVQAQIDIENKKRAAILKQTNLTEIERRAVIAQSDKKLAELNDKLQEEALQDEITNLQFLRNIKLEDDALTNEQRLQIERDYQKDKANLMIEELGSQAALIKAELEQLSADGSTSLIKPLTPEEETALKEQLNLVNEKIAQAAQTINGIEGEEAGLNLLNGLGLDEAGSEKLNFAFQTISAALTSITDLMGAASERNKKLIQEQADQGVISQDEADKKIQKIEKRAFKRQKAMQIAMAIVSTSQAVLAALSQTTDFTPTQSIRTANAIAAGVFGGAQIATIAAQKFQDGGMPNKLPKAVIIINL